MKIAFYELEDWEKPLIAQNFPNDEITYSNEHLDANSLPSKNDHEAISIFVNSKIDKAVLDSFPNLKLITSRSTGYDHIDLETCKQRGIAVAFVPGYGDNTVAEYTFGLILNLTRKIYQAINQVKENGSFNLLGLRGIDLKEKTLGVIGVGRIGREVIKIAKGFEMNVQAFSPHPDENLARQLGFKNTSLDNLLASSDIITLHCPYTPQTHHIINRDNLKLARKGSYIVNTARGGLIETAALVWALEEKILAGAALDVLEEEGEIKNGMNFMLTTKPNEEELRAMVADHILMKMPNVLITPHNAFNSSEALVRILTTTIENIKTFQKGEPDNLVPQ